MADEQQSHLKKITGPLPYRIALAGGWIDQPFLSSLNPDPPGSMVVVSVEPAFRFMDRAGIASSTRRMAETLWKDGLPQGDPAALVRALYLAENEGKAEPSGSQDMIGIIYPGISRLDYDITYADGLFPVRIDSCCDAATAAWLEGILHVVPVSQRPLGYNPLGIKNLDPDWINRLGQTGKDCYQAILQMDIDGLGRSMNECMACWEAILPHTVRHPTIHIDLVEIMRYYQSWYRGAMFSGCGGGYLFVVSEKTVPGSFRIKVRLV